MSQRSEEVGGCCAVNQPRIKTFLELAAVSSVAHCCFRGRVNPAHSPLLSLCRMRESFNCVPSPSICRRSTTSPRALTPFATQSATPLCRAPSAAAASAVSFFSPFYSLSGLVG